MTKIVDKNQIQLDLGTQLELQKEKRKKFLTEKKKTRYCYNQLSLDNLLKITYDITDKDFEYFCKLILEKDGYKNVVVKGGLYDEGVDIEAYKDGKLYFIQCKQWGSDYVDEKIMGEYYGRIFHKKQEHPNAIFQYITTSYLYPRAREFCRGNTIKFMDNTDLIPLCEKLGISKLENWKNIRLSIYKNRMEYLKSKGFSDLKKELKRIGLKEYRNHIDPKIRHQVSVNPLLHNSVSEFLQLVESI